MTAGTRTGSARMGAAVAALVMVATVGVWAPTPADAAVPSAAGSEALLATSRTMQSTAAVQITLQGAPVGGSAPPAISGMGRFDFRSGRGAVGLMVPAPGGATALHQTVFLPTLVYVRPPSPHAASLPAGKSWIVAELGQIESSSANFPQFVLQEEGLSPYLSLQQLAWGAVSAASIPARHLDGTTASGFAVRVDLSKALNVASHFNAALAVAIKTEISGLGPPGSAAAPLITERIWVEGGRVVLLEASPPGAGIGVTTTQFSRYGTRVDVRAPSAKTVIDITRLTPAAEKEAGVDVA